MPAIDAALLFFVWRSGVKGNFHTWDSTDITVISQSYPTSNNPLFQTRINVYLYLYLSFRYCITLDVGKSVLKSFNSKFLHRVKRQYTHHFEFCLHFRCDHKWTNESNSYFSINIKISLKYLIDELFFN